MSHYPFATKSNLARRFIIAPGLSGDCVLCEGMIESSAYLLLHCDFVHKIWDQVFRWFGLVVVIPSNISFLFQILSCMCIGKEVIG
jgi:hypothetical protein